MSASTSQALWPSAPAVAAGTGLRFAHQVDGAVRWRMKAPCSMRPSHLLMAYAGLCGLSLGVALFFWWQGVRLVMPFAWIEVLAVGAAIGVHARHAADAERIELRDGRLTVEVDSGARLERVEFDAAWVRVEGGTGGALIVLTSAGRGVRVGRHLRPEWRPLLADELRGVLRGGLRAAA